MFDPVAGLATAVDAVLDTDLAALPDDAVGARILALDTQLRRLEAGRAAAVRDFERRGACVDDGAATPVAWLQAKTNLSRHDAISIRTLGRDAERLPVMAAALAAGDITAAHLQILGAATRRHDPDRVAADEKTLVDLARQFDPRTFALCVERWVAVTFPDRHERDTENAYDSRWLRLAETLGGMVSVAGMLDPDTARLLQLAIDALARKAGASDDRTQAQRNADALGDLARIALNADQLPVTGGSRPSVSVIVREETLRGSAGSDEPATFAEGAPLTDAQLERTLCDARFARLIVNALSETLDLGRLTRDISPALRKYLHLRDGGCRVGGCDKPAHATDAHHIVWWRFGGRTDRENLVLLCAFHHYLVHDRGWTIEMDAQAVVTFTSPDRLRTLTSRPRGTTQLAL